MLRLKNLSNRYQKRTIRPLYAQTQATPYATALDPAFRGADGSLVLPLSGDTAPLNTRTAAAFTYQGSLVPGLVLVRTVGEVVAVATGSTTVKEQPFGFLANFIGGDFDEGFSGDSLQNEVGAWRGPDSVFEVLAPAFNDTGLAAAFAASAVSKGNPVLLYAGADGRLQYVSSPTGTQVPVARLVNRVNQSRIIVDTAI